MRGTRLTREDDRIICCPVAEAAALDEVDAAQVSAADVLAFVVVLRLVPGESHGPERRESKRERADYQ